MESALVNWNKLPPAVWGHTYGFVDAQGLLAMLAVSKQHNTHTSFLTIWKKRCNERGMTISIPPRLNDWKATYLNAAYMGMPGTRFTFRELSCELLREFHSRTAPMIALKDTSHCLVLNPKGTPCLWDVNTDKEVRQFSLNVQPKACMCGHRFAQINPFTVVCQLREKDIFKLNLTDGSSKKLSGVKQVNEICGLPDGRLAIADGFETYTVNLETDEVERIADSARVHSITALANGCLALSTLSNVVRIHPAPADDLPVLDVQKLETDRSSPDLALVPPCDLRDGRVAVSVTYTSDDKVGNACSIYVVTRSTKKIVELKGHTDSLTSMVALANGVLVSASSDHTIRSWNPTTGQELSRTDWGHTDIHLSPLGDGRLVAAGRLDGSDEHAKLFVLRTALNK